MAQTRVDTLYHSQRSGPKKIKQIAITKGNVAKVTEYSEYGYKTAYYTLKEGKKQGTYTQYHPDGKVFSTINYEQGKKFGVETSYYSDGDKKSCITYWSNLKLGSFVHWYENKQIHEKGVYDTLIIDRPNDARIESVLSVYYIRYFGNGKKEREQFYQKGKLHGEAKEWHLNGNLKSEIEYKNGLPFGKKILYYDNGKCSAKGNVFQEASEGYVAPKFEGKQISYYPNGNIRWQQEYLNNEPHGSWVTYNGQGILIEQKMFERGQLSGDFVTYYPNGKLYERKPYQVFQINGRDTGLMHGTQEVYFEKGNKMQDFQLAKGKPYGYLNSYFENGKLARQLFFFGAQDQYALIKEYNERGILLKEGTFAIDPKDSTKYRKLIFASYSNEGVLLHKMSHTDALPFGRFESYYSNGKLLMEGFVFDKKNSDYFGPEDLGTSWQAVYYPDGSLRYEVFSVNNFKHGQLVEWFPNGKLKRFMDPIGLDIQWLQSGELMTSLAYNANNNLVRDTLLNEAFVKSLYKNLSNSATKQLFVLNQANGPQTSYYGHGKKHFQTIVQDGNFDKYFIAYTYAGDTLVYIDLKQTKMDGKYLVKNVNGTYYYEGNFSNGKEVGAWRVYSRDGKPRNFFAYDSLATGYKPYFYEYTFYENGSIENYGTYSQGKKQGWHLAYHPNGTLRDSTYFENDTVNGRNISFDDEGKRYAVQNYVKGVKTGLQIQHYYKPYGSGIMREEFYVNNKRDGEARYYHKNGKLNLIAFFKEDKEDSVWYYFDSLGAFTETVTYKMGAKVVQELKGKCPCRDSEPTRRFAQRLTSLLEDDTDINLWQFPYHESVNEIVKTSFFKNLQTDGDRGSVYYQFDLINFQPMLLGIPNKGGMKLWLNPCWHKGEQSEIEVSVQLYDKQPDLTNLHIGSRRMAYVLPSKMIKPVNIAEKQVLAQFSSQGLRYNLEGISFEGVAPICTDDFYLLSSKYTCVLDTFQVKDLSMLNDFDALSYRLSFYHPNPLPASLKKMLEKTPLLIEEGAGSLTIQYKGLQLETKVSQFMVSQDLVAGLITLPNVKMKEDKLFVTLQNGEQSIVESELLAQLKSDGFTYAGSWFNPESKQIEIWFYIHKP
jgi:antitoxin component YwqK of YwqJK toxin-antitoxin module